MSINIQLDGCGTGASYCGPVDPVAADRGPVCLLANVHHTSHFVTPLSRGRTSHMLSRYKVQCYTVTPFVSHYITEQPLSCYQGRDKLDTRTLPPLRHKECKGWRTKRSSDYVKLSTVCC